MAKTDIEISTIKGNTKYKGIRADKLFGNLPLYVAKGVKKGILNTGIEVFDKSMKRVPVDTGKLARSGKVTIDDELYAKGECPSTATANGKEQGGETSIAITKKENSMIPNAQDKQTVDSGKIELQISFQRTGDNDVGLDVALWTHETLLPLGSGPQHARRPGTSGKYLEASLNEVSGQLEDLVQQGISEALKNIK